MEIRERIMRTVWGTRLQQGLKINEKPGPTAFSQTQLKACRISELINAFLPLTIINQYKKSVAASRFETRFPDPWLGRSGKVCASRA